MSVAEMIQKYIFDMDFRPYYDYLDTIVNFLETEEEKRNQDVDEIKQKIESGLVEPDDGQSPAELDELDYYQDRLYDIYEFNNILFSSFFVTIYFFLESKLTSYCRKLGRGSKEEFSAASNGILARAKTYLTKVHQIDYSFGGKEWKRIQDYAVLRHCIVHNQGRVDEGFREDKRDKLLKFIQSPDSKLKLIDSWCVLNKEFCLEALDNINAFLYSITFAEKKVP